MFNVFSKKEILKIQDGSTKQCFGSGSFGLPQPKMEIETFFKDLYKFLLVLFSILKKNNGSSRIRFLQSAGSAKKPGSLTETLVKSIGIPIRQYDDDPDAGRLTLPK